MEEPILYTLEPIDEQNPAAGYRAIVQHRDLIEAEALAEALIEEGLPTDVETVLGLFYAELAAVASLLWEGWDVTIASGVLETPRPDAQQAALLGGTATGRPVASRTELTLPRHFLNLVATESLALIDWLEGYRELEQRQIDDPPRPLLDSYENLSAERDEDEMCAGDEVCLRGIGCASGPRTRARASFVTEAGAAGPPRSRG